MAAEAAQRANIARMTHANGYDVVIVCCGSEHQARYWQSRLDQARGQVLPTNATVLAVQEDWPGGAGNALGTLYAYQNAVKLAKRNHNMDIPALLEAKAISVGLYHTAGKGTRLAPLPGAENNNKPGVKLPATIKIKGENVSITILEAVIKQTGVYASSRKGRLSVFWGDQVFIPTAPVEYNPQHHVDILCSLGPMLTAEEWAAKGMDKYGLIVVAEDGKTAQVEKVTHATAVNLLKSMGKIASVGASLGSFSVSFAMLACLLEEFSQELASKQGKFDADPHLWMPMTLEQQAYLHLMTQKGIPEEIAAEHFARITEMVNKFRAEESTHDLRLFGAVDVGEGMYWWDYGQLKLYQRNTMLITQNTAEAEMMRQFFDIGVARVKDSAVMHTTIDSVSCVSACWLGRKDGRDCGSVRNSVLSNVRCNYIDVEGVVLVNVTAKSIIARPGCIIYNYVDDSDYGVELEDGQVLAGVFNEDGTQVVMRSLMSIDGGTAWQDQLDFNKHSFEEVYRMNADADPSHLERQIISAHRRLWQNISDMEAPHTAADMQHRLDKTYWTGFAVGTLSSFAALGAILFAKLLVSKH